VLRHDVERLLASRLQDELLQFERRGLVDVDDVSAQRGGVRPAKVYRISAKAVAAISSGRQIAPPGSRGPEDCSVYVPAGPLRALQALRAVLEEPSAILVGEKGWTTEQQLFENEWPEIEKIIENFLLFDPAADAAWRGDAAPALPPRWFSANDLAWLLVPQFAQRWGHTPPGRIRPLILWRCTPLGAAARPLEWSDGDS